jgi:hypothetical protein
MCINKYILCSSMLKQFLEKKVGLGVKDCYFVCKKMTELYWEEVQYEGNEDNKQSEDFSDFDSNLSCIGPVFFASSNIFSVAGLVRWGGYTCLCSSFFLGFLLYQLIFSPIKKPLSGHIILSLSIRQYVVLLLPYWLHKF